MEPSPQILQGSTHSSRKPTRGSDRGGSQTGTIPCAWCGCAGGTPLWVPSVMGGHGWGQRGSWGG